MTLSWRHQRRWLKAGLVLVTLLLLIGDGFLIFSARPAHADTATPTTTIQWNDVHQTIDGFGVASAWSADFLQQFPEPQRSHVLDLLFSQQDGAGFSIVRNEIGSGGGIPATTSTQTIEPTEGNFVWTGDAGQIWVMKEAKKRGASNFVSSVWSPPAWMKDNNSVINGGYLLPNKYQAYADYLAAYVRGYQSHFGLTISAISPSNEPNTIAAYQTAQWTASQFQTFIRDYLRPTFKKNHLSTKVFLPEEATWTDDLASATLQDPAASAGVDIIAAHDYTFSAPQPFADAQAQGKHQWQSEVSGGSTDPGDINDALKWAFEIQSHLVDAQSNAWNWWIGTEPHAPTDGDGQALIYLDQPNGTYTPTKRLFSIGNFSRFIRPGDVRIGATANPALGLYTSAYKDPQNKHVVVVAMNKTTSYRPLDLTFNSVTPVLLTPYVTSKTESLERHSDIIATDGTATTIMPPQSVVTFVGSLQTPKTKQFSDPLNDLSVVAATTNTADWFTDSANAGNFNLDGSRVGRVANADLNLVYHIPDMQAASATVYFSNSAIDSTEVVLKASADGIHFKEVETSHDKPFLVNYWSRVNYTAKHLPRGTAYLMIEVLPNVINQVWTPEIAHVDITVPVDAVVPTPPVPTQTPMTSLTDPLNDFSLVASHSNNWYFDSANTANFDGDTSRASRTDNNDATITYSAPGMKSATVRLYYWGNAPDSNNLVLKVSADGINYTTLNATQDTPIQVGDWYRVNYSVSALPADAAYLLLEVPANSSNVTWTPQISQVVISLV